MGVTVGTPQPWRLRLPRDFFRSAVPQREASGRRFARAQASMISLRPLQIQCGKQMGNRNPEHERREVRTVAPIYFSQATTSMTEKSHSLLNSMTENCTHIFI